MQADSTGSPYRPPWRLEEIDFTRLEPDRVHGDETLFFFLVTASFIEAASALSAVNLGAHYAGDREVVEWLRDQWAHEEVQHGRALRAYVDAVWPGFDWERAYAGFLAEYSALLTPTQLEPSRGLEMAARCVVETGTSSLYRAVHDWTDEPVLRDLTDRIRSDEVRHFSHFYRSFQHYRVREGLGRYRVVRAMIRRIAEAKSDDALIAYRHAFGVRYPQRRFEVRHFDDYRASLRRVMQRSFPYEMAMKMLLKPLSAPRVLNSLLSQVLAYGARRLLFA